MTSQMHSQNISNQRSVSITADESIANERLDVVIFKFIEDLPSRSFASKLIEHGSVLCNNKKQKSSYRIKLGDVIFIDFAILDSKSAPPVGEKIPLEILFEDEHLLVINKPAGMVVHPGAGIYSGTLVNAILAHCGQTLPSLGDGNRAGIVHRLDKDTSGIMVVAKSQIALTKLSAQFASHEQERRYLALVYGMLLNKSGTLKTWHGRDPRNRLRYAVQLEGVGKIAQLNYSVQECFFNNLVSLVNCELYTGRTHQIRVQMTNLGHPLLGDQTYGTMPHSVFMQKEFASQIKKRTARQMLHACHLAFVHPVTDTKQSFTCAPPTDFGELLSYLKTAAS